MTGLFCDALPASAAASFLDQDLALRAATRDT